MDKFSCYQVCERLVQEGQEQIRQNEGETRRWRASLQFVSRQISESRVQCRSKQQDLCPLFSPRASSGSLPAYCCCVVPRSRNRNRWSVRSRILVSLSLHDRGYGSCQFFISVFIPGGDELKRELLVQPSLMYRQAGRPTVIKKRGRKQARSMKSRGEGGGGNTYTSDEEHKESEMG